MDEWVHYNFTKYNQQPEYGYIPPFSSVPYTDELTELQPEDDAATVLWGEDWQTPSLEQFAELRDKEYTTWESEVNGLRVTSKANGNSIFLPITGIYYDTTLDKDIIRYWTRSLVTGDSKFVWVASGSETKPEGRHLGCPVRAVRKK